MSATRAATRGARARLHGATLGTLLKGVLAGCLALEGAACDSSSAEPSDAGTIDARCAPVPMGTTVLSPDCGIVEFLLPCGPEPDPLRVDCRASTDFCNVVCPVNARLSPCDYEPPACAPDGSVSGPQVVLGCPTCLGNLGRAGRAVAAQAKRPRGLTVGAWAEEATYLEAGSVLAFRALAAELASFGAPRTLIRACARAEKDERRHARSAARIARRFDAPRTAPRRRTTRARTLEALVTENAIEGCVRETFGALVALHQAAFAGDPAIAEHAAQIAPDEARHAALAWRIDAWGRARLDEGARARVEEARTRALRRLQREARARLPRAVSEAIGAPSSARARALVAGLARAIA